MSRNHILLCSLTLFLTGLISPLSFADSEWDEYIDAKISSGVNYLVHESYNKYLKNVAQKRAFDLGSGSGNEDVYLLNKGWHVTGLDSDERSGALIGFRAEDLPGKFDFQHAQFVDMKPTGIYDLFFSIYALPFGEKSNLKDIVSTISYHLTDKGLFVFNMFGENASFVLEGGAYSVEEEGLKALLSDYGFEIKYLFRRQFKANDVEGNSQQWDIFDVIAMRKM